MSKKNTNLVLLTGNLTRDPEVRFLQTGTAICEGSIASNRQTKRGEQWVEEAVFVEFTIWGKTGEAFARYHKRGSPALLRGRLTLDEWNDKTTGQKRSRLKVTVEEWEFMSTGSAPASSDDAEPTTKPAVDDSAF
jgi:single-strand DNA-binding protein